MRSPGVLVGAVAYSPNAVTIWEGIRDHFRGAEVELDYLLFSNYERQVEALLAGQIDIAWNTNLAWVRTVGRTGGRCRALAMRDSDIGYRTVFVGRRGEAPADLADLRGRRLALGSRDSAQAAILPLHFLSQAGVPLAEVELVRFDSDVGKHGDTGRSELEAMLAVHERRADAAPVGMSTWRAVKHDGLEVFWTSPGYCHCNFTALDRLEPERAEAWVRHLLAMDWEDPRHRPILELEGLRRWVRPELEGYRPLFEAVERQLVPMTW
jgi:ABC-type phosphate/phosphonate transport system substrate-binding protein